MSFKDKLNIYTCKTCREHIVTKDVDEGVTPFMIDCKVTRDCKGYMQSSMYRVFDQTMRHDWEWYKPALSDVREPMKEHVRMGGLILREVQP